MGKQNVQRSFRNRIVALNHLKTNRRYKWNFTESTKSFRATVDLAILNVIRTRNGEVHFTEMGIRNRNTEILSNWQSKLQ